MFLDGAREVDEGRVERFDFSAGEIFEEAAKGDEVVGLSEGGKAFVTEVVGVAVEFEAIFAEEFGGDFDRFDIVFIEEL